MSQSQNPVESILPPGVRFEENVRVPMRDGIKIAVDVYRPEKAGRYPALLSTSAYIKAAQPWPPELSHSIEAGSTFFFVAREYVHVVAQARGSGLSQGQYNWYDRTEQLDGAELIEWIARQPWCNGNVGMLGDSYFGRMQWLIAGEQPPHLKAIAPYDASMDDYRSRHEGGLIKLGFLGMWGADTTLQCLWPGPVEGKLPPTNLFAEIGSHPDDGPFYWERSGYTKADKIKIPVLNIAAAGSEVHSKSQLWGHKLIKSPNKLLVLPALGFFANVFLIRSKPLNEYISRWYDHWLKGIDTGIMKEPPVAICDSATGEWRYENEYPLARTEWTKFYLRANTTGPATKPPYGLLSLESPQQEAPDSYATPECMQLVFTRRPVLAFSTTPLEKDTRVWGPLSATLYGSSTTTDTAWFVKVCDVAPDEQVTPLTTGVLKASYQEVDQARSAPGQPFHPFRNPARPEPNKIYEYQVEIIPIFHTFKKGHKIWIQIASHDIEYLTPLHTEYTWEMLPIPAKNTVYHDANHPSHILLPIIPDAPIIRPVEPPLSQVKWPMGDTAMR